MIFKYCILGRHVSLKLLYCLPLVLSLGACGAGSGDLATSPVISGDIGAGSALLPPPAPIPVPIVVPHLKMQFKVDQSRNNQGLAFGDGYYYVSYDVAGSGFIERYDRNGVLDPEYGRVSVRTGHSAELAYRVADKRVYVVSGGGTSPTFVYQLGADGKSIGRTYDFSSFGNSGLLAIDNKKDLLIVGSTQTGGDNGQITFRYVDWNNNNNVVNQFTIPYQGIPQGLEVYGDILYYYTNNKITLLDKTGLILDQWELRVAGESEGIAVVEDAGETYLAVGYNGPRRVYTIRPIQLGTITGLPNKYVLNEE